MPEAQWGLRPEGDLGSCGADSPHKHRARIAHYFVLYARTCREDGDLGAACESVEWGMKTDWGRVDSGGSHRRSATSIHMHVYMHDEGALVLGHLLLDLMAAMADALEVPSEAASDSLLPALAARFEAVVDLPGMAQALELGWKLFRVLALNGVKGRAGNASVHGWAYVEACVQAASLDGRAGGAQTLGPVRLEGGGVSQESFLLGMAQVRCRFGPCSVSDWQRRIHAIKSIRAMSRTTCLNCCILKRCVASRAKQTWYAPEPGERSLAAATSLVPRTCRLSVPQAVLRARLVH